MARALSDEPPSRSRHSPNSFRYYGHGNIVIYAATADSDYRGGCLVERVRFGERPDMDWSPHAAELIGQRSRVDGRIMTMSAGIGRFGIYSDSAADVVWPGRIDKRRTVGLSGVTRASARLDA